MTQRSLMGNRKYHTHGPPTWPPRTLPGILGPLPKNYPGQLHSPGNPWIDMGSQWVWLPTHPPVHMCNQPWLVLIKSFYIYTEISRCHSVSGWLRDCGPIIGDGSVWSIWLINQVEWLDFSQSPSQGLKLGRTGSPYLLVVLILIIASIMLTYVIEYESCG